MQKIPDHRWRAEASEIYRQYHIYHQSGGVEQSVFDATSGRPSRRSVVVAHHLAQALNLKGTGRLLDFGSGNGAMLAAFSEVRPQWSLFGFELDDRNLARHTEIPGFCELYTGALNNVSGRFDLVTMSHALEHLQTPESVLRHLAPKLARDGRLFVQVPDAGVNPFDLVVADHLCHFTPDTLALLVSRSGFAIERIQTNWITKEISLLARLGDSPDTPQTRVGVPLTIDRVRERISWLHAVLEGARCAATTRPFGLFGTSISATWLFGQLADDVEFFVDEDPARIGGRHLDRPIWRPDEAPADAVVYLVLLPALAQSVRERLRTLPLRLCLPPSFPV